MRSDKWWSVEVFGMLLEYLRKRPTLPDDVSCDMLSKICSDGHCHDEDAVFEDELDTSNNAVLVEFNWSGSSIARTHSMTSGCLLWKSLR